MKLKRGETYTLDGKTGTIQELSALLGITKQSVSERLHRIANKALTSPPSAKPTPIVNRPNRPRFVGPQPLRPAGTSLTGAARQRPELINGSDFHKELVAYLQWWRGGDQQKAIDNIDTAYLLVCWLNEDEEVDND